MNLRFVLAALLATTVLAACGGDANRRNDGSDNAPTSTGTTSGTSGGTTGGTSGGTTGGTTGGSGGGSGNLSSAAVAVCQQASSIDWTTKTGDCQGLTTSNTTLAQCESEIAPCNASDVSILSTMLTCLKNLPACSSANEQAWFGQLQQCAQNEQELTAACQQSFKPTGG